MIPREIIEEIRSRSNIVEKISRYVELKKKGDNFVGKCPFLDHEDSRPSFSVSDSKQVYHCFGCGRSGNIFTFLMEYEGLSFLQAARVLARECGVRIEETSQEIQDITSGLYELYERAAEFYHKSLHKISNEENYFVQRGLNRETIDTYRLGFCSGFIHEARDLYSSEVLEKSGLFYYKGLKTEDFFLGRWMFPYYDVNCRVIGFGGKSIDDREAPYLNSRDSLIYSKASYLYGLGQAKDRLVEKKSTILVEGYFDVLSLVQFGVNLPVLGVCGTSLTLMQSKLLSRFCRKVFLFYDGDAAGQGAIDSSFPYLYENEIEVFVLEILKGEDPDSLIKKGLVGSVFSRDQIEDSALPWFEYFKNRGLEKSRKIVLAREIADRIRDSDKRRLFVETCSEILNVDSSLLYERRYIRKKGPDLYNRVRKEFDREELLLLAALVCDPKGFDHSYISNYVFSSSQLQFLFEKLKLWDRKEQSSLFDNLSKDDVEILSYILVLATSVPGVEYVVSLLKRRKLNITISEVVKEIKNREKLGEDCSELVKKLDLLIGGVRSDT